MEPLGGRDVRPLAAPGSQSNNPQSILLGATAKVSILVSDYTDAAIIIEIAVVAESDDAQAKMLGIGNLVKSHSTGLAEFAVLVADEEQGRGIGGELLRRLIAVGRDEAVNEIIGSVLPSNVAMLAICARLGFERRGNLDDGVIQTVLRLD